MQILTGIKRIFTIFAAYFQAVLHILKTRQQLALFLQEQRPHLSSVGLVPTMGALHKGHLSLLSRSVEENGLTVCSIFVNPTQFNDPADLDRYPRPVESDIEKLRQTGCDALFMPAVGEIYPEEEKWHIELGELERIMEGKHRPGHYQGVTQIVKKLFDLVEPQRAYFGQKDYQQFLVIGKMVRLFSIPLELICCPTEREPDGLAMSSRNVHLSPREREEAGLLPEALFMAREAAQTLNPDEVRSKALELLASSPLITVEYLEIADARSLQPVKTWEQAGDIIVLAAIRLGQTRLIDNLFIKQSQ
ncbi:pantothenate synthetase [Anseongella ginsenosidimutans]|uniref:Pantothenate synthetase n=1 Tax=Anseongella ginsenosidimutans TaxID=496056 RepID=A0A4R3KVY3_9SPHI|nr:pantoate--beta-alanine ligase [Anseongella ginsenosidimutans]QEC51406.1 pantoate--beta-alanine ligase [Anseongella ginsenosidimutans]TCS89889.1 pantothenate synthetase [Anseongella ginsenosidimutans]